MKTKRIVLGMTGGIAAFKAAELTRLMVKASAHIQVVMSEAAQRFVTATTMQALSGNPVYSDLWDPSIANGMAHIELSRDADLIIVAPASADFMAKLANGLADDLLSTLCLARDCPLMIAPAMNRQMWEHPATQRNVATLRNDGVIVIGPDSGSQACGESGMGRMTEPESLCEEILTWFEPKTLAGVRMLVTAGPTFERIDAVRGITNRSSGKMGFALARAARDAGAKVHVVAGPVSIEAPAGISVTNVTSAQEMLAGVEARLGECDIFVAVAAVADYAPLNPKEHKIKKDAQIMTLELAPTVDILANVASRANPPFCVGFAAESERLEEYAEAKRRRKNVPLLVANLAQDAIGADETEILLLDDFGHHRLPKNSKLVQARLIVEHIARLYSSAR